MRQRFSPTAAGLAALLGVSLLSFAAFSSRAIGQHQHGPSADKAGKTAAGTKPAAPNAGAKNSCAACLERAPILDPAKFAGWNDVDVKRAYEAARKYPDTLDRLHCFCECKESPREHHKTLLTCFTDEHAAGCGICQHEALMAARLKDQGVSDEQVEITVENVSKTDGHAPTFGRGL